MNCTKNNKMLPKLQIIMRKTTQDKTHGQNCIKQNKIQLELEVIMIKTTKRKIALRYRERSILPSSSDTEKGA